MANTDPTMGAAPASDVTVRVADRLDAPALARLAALDSAALPAGPTLLAEVEGEAVAALPLGGGPAVADPFRRTRAAIELLELRAAQLRGPGEAGARVRLGGWFRTLTGAPRAAPLR